ncbi:hypothetical protein AMTR_s00090p00103490 [Amborella trichopoda]|uniref:Peptidase C1A papain C-terminal domain-containing protein n=1 Tax=Amborella trichopoda TaxID=13333 RepID=W1P3W1_AMBTC|nr:hypothetical protein AMTR_s00090p00103490 [Amborella trichopoda]
MSLSEQELVDFVNTTGSQGGFKEDGFQSIMDNCWLSSVVEYPFRGVNRTCNTEKSTWVDKIKDPLEHRMGERGYIRMQRDVAAPEGICGIAMAASYRIA